MTGEGDDLGALKFVGPATADSLADSEITADEIRRRQVSFRMLREAGVNPGVAARIRREHSLPWSFETEEAEDLERRSAQVRGLGEAERAWVAASSGNWEDEPIGTTPAADGPAEGEAAGGDPADGEPRADTAGDGSGDPVAAESAWQDRSAPTPVTELDAVDDGLEQRLATAGVTSVRSLAVADAEAVADALGLEPDTVTDLQAEAKSYVS